MKNRRALFCLALVMPLCLRADEPYEQAPIFYSETEPQDPAQRLENGRLPPCVSHSRRCGFCAIATLGGCTVPSPDPS
jgi:hypothetical protein